MNFGYVSLAVAVLVLAIIGWTIDHRLTRLENLVCCPEEVGADGE